MKAPTSAGYHETKELVREPQARTRYARKPAARTSASAGASKHATFMILGDICTRACSFCNVATGMPLPLDANEPENVA